MQCIQPTLSILGTFHPGGVTLSALHGDSFISDDQHITMKVATFGVPRLAYVSIPGRIASAKPPVNKLEVATAFQRR